MAIPCYPNLTALPEKPEAIDMVVSPAAGEKIIREAARLGITRICSTRNLARRFFPS